MVYAVCGICMSIEVVYAVWSDIRNAIPPGLVMIEVSDVI